MNQFFKALLLVFVFVGLSHTMVQAQTVDPNFKDGSLIFKLRDDYNFTGMINKDKSVVLSDLTFMSDLISTYGVTRVSRELTALNDPKLMRVFFVEFSDINRIDEFVKMLKNVDEVEYVEKDALKQLLWTPNDPYYSSAYGGIGTSKLNLNWHLNLIKASLAWDIQKGSPSIKVGVVDNAIWGEHPDLQISGENQCNASVSPAVSGVGKSAPPTSINQSQVCTMTQLTTPGQCPASDWSHGTHCAGLIGAINNNGVGISSIGGGVTIVAARAGADNGGIASTNTLRGCDFCISRGIKVLSISLGSTNNTPTEQTYFSTAYNNGITIVAAAGNDGDGANAIMYPAGYPNVISVASVNSDKKLSSFSQYGTWIDVACPGGYYVLSGSITLPNMLSTTYALNQFLRLYGATSITGNYDGKQGTSMAAPMVAGLCGLLLSKNPAATPAKIESCLKSTVQPLGAGSRQIMAGGGIVDAQAALNCVALGIENEDFSTDVSLYPNPATESFSISFSGNTFNHSDVVISDISGKVIKASKYSNSGELVVETSDMPNGIYVVTVKNDNRIATKKVSVIR